MNIGVVSKRYAKALLDFAIAKGNEEKIYNEVETLAGHFANVPDLKRTVENPVVTRKMKLDLLVEAAGGKDVSEEMKRFLQLVIDGKREKFLDPSIIGGYIMEIDGYRLDASVANQLRNIRRQFIDKNRRIV